ncbi:MAG: DNA repair protein [Yoonia sp.]|uniref:DNA repair protein n=1 Tax=Yoonia sp. TaxID=2212373 RepID=UPI003262F287
MFLFLRNLARMCHALSLFLVAAIALALAFYTIMCAFGQSTWLTMPLTFGETTIPEAGMYLQIILTVLVGSMAFYLPTNTRIMALENSHRKFQISMHDVAKAYHEVHTADRSGVFTLSSEFDAIRERLAYLRDHPDMEQLEPSVMEVAAQMSQQSRHLADVYSDEKVARAKAFLVQRQEEAEKQQERIVEALHACTEIRKWAQQVELEESIVASQLAQLDEKLQKALPALGYSLEHDDGDEFMEDLTMPDLKKDVDSNVLILAQKPAAE